MTQLMPTEVPEGLRLTATGLEADGVVARQLATHRVEIRPGRRMSNCRFDAMAGNTMTALHLSHVPPLDFKCDHRHMDETMGLVVVGRGRTELRQHDDAGITQAEWEAGDVLVTPTNAWHRHVNTHAEEPFRQLSFRNKPLMDTLVRGDDTPEDLYGAHFNRRFADEPEWFSVWEGTADGAIRTNFIRQVADQPLPAADPTLGRDVRVQRYLMGGQRTLDVAVVGMGPGGAMRPHCPLAEEALYVLRGSGQTDLWKAGGPARTVTWKQGDLVVPPLAVWRQHRASGQGALLLKVRNVAFERALGVEGLDTGVPDRFPDLLEPTSSSG